jgi:hypothetical protein
MHNIFSRTFGTRGFHKHIVTFDENLASGETRAIGFLFAIAVPHGDRTRMYNSYQNPGMMMPTAIGTGGELGLLDSSYIGIFRLELDPVAVHLNGFLELALR